MCWEINIIFLPSANEVWGKVIFLHLSVILFTGGRGEYLAGTPRAGTPRAGSPLAGTLLAGTPPPSPRADLYTAPRVGTTPGRYTPLPGRYTPPRLQCMLEYGQQAGGTHPTGMHSCVIIFCKRCRRQLFSFSRFQLDFPVFLIKKVNYFSVPFSR